MKTSPKKHYGQHFLRDTGIINRIVGFINPQEGDLMFEVGPGDGALSIRLVPKVYRLLAMEIDRDLISVLKEKLAPFRNSEVLVGDILNTDLNEFLISHGAPGTKLRVVGNLPYNIGTAIIERLLSLSLPIEDMTFMLQLETAERICAAPGSREYGFFSVYCQHFCSIKMGFKVTPACFVPRPKVYSAMLSMVLRPKRRDSEADGDFIAAAKAAFAYRRKTLENSLRRDPRLGPVAALILSASGINGSRRAEELAVEEYERLSLVYGQYRRDAARQLQDRII